MPIAILSHFLTIALSAGAATEYVVALDGCDTTHDGRSRATAFATLQRGIDALEPGDTLSLLPGEYVGGVRREGLGDANHDTVIRAAIPGTVLLRGDVPVKGFRPAPGFRYVHVADFAPETEVQAVNEVDTLRVLERMPTAAELEFVPGTFFHDASAGKLYVSATDMQPATVHRYTAAVTPDHGLYLARPRRVVVEGLAVTGFNTVRERDLRENTGRGAFGIILVNANDCVILDCRAWLNGRGIGFNSHAGDSGGNRIERCTAWGNASKFGTGGALTLLNARRDILCDSKAFLNPGRYGIRLYGGRTGFPGTGDHEQSFLINNLSWGNGAPIGVKTGFEYVHEVHHSIGLGSQWEIATNRLHHAVIGQSARRYPEDTIHLAGETDLDSDAEFADPVNFDFRLQATSRFRGAGPEGEDRGPFPWRTEVYFVRPGGDDGADGLSMARAWRTLARALPALQPGDTLYLAPGRYDVPAEPLRLAGEPDAPIAILGRGRGPVVLSGLLQLRDSRHLRVSRLTFADTITLAGGEGLELSNNVMQAGAIGLHAATVVGLRVTHCLFTGFAHAGLDLRQSRDVFLSRNLFDNAAVPAVRIDGDSDATLLYADYNRYAEASRAWRVGDVDLALNALRPRYERHALDGPFPVERANGVARPVTPLHSAAAAPVGLPFGGPLGVNAEAPSRQPRLDGPHLHGVSATTADIEWTVTGAESLHLAWGETPETEQNVNFRLDQGFGQRMDSGFSSFSLTGLEPGRRYTFRLEARGQMPEETQTGALLVFETLAVDPEPVEYYVSPQGSDDFDGRSVGRPFRTIARAAAAVRPGDTVQVGEGVYPERLRMRATGAPGRPITFRAQDDAQVVLDGEDKSLDSLVVMHDKHHLRIDGFYLREIGGTGSVGGALRIFRGSDIRISRVFYDARADGYLPRFFFAVHTRDLHIRNSVSLHAFNTFRVFECPGFRMENCLIIRNMIGVLTTNNRAVDQFVDPLDVPAGEDPRAVYRNNIFTDANSNKLQHPLFWGLTPANARLENNAFVLRVPEAERLMFGWNHRSALADWDAEAGPTRSWVGDPRFAVLFRDGADPGEGFTPDRLLRRDLALTFEDLFATHPDVVERGIGLDPNAF